MFALNDESSFYHDLYIAHALRSQQSFPVFDASLFWRFIFFCYLVHISLILLVKYIILTFKYFDFQFVLTPWKSSQDVRRRSCGPRC